MASPSLPPMIRTNLPERATKPDSPMPEEFDSLIEKLFTKMDDHDLLKEVANDQRHMLKTMDNFILAANTRMGELEVKQEKLETRHESLVNRMNYFCGGLAGIMFIVEIFFKK